MKRSNGSIPIVLVLVALVSFHLLAAGQGWAGPRGQKHLSEDEVERTMKKPLVNPDRKEGIHAGNKVRTRFTNFGSIGGIHAVPIINYPQSGILGVGRILDRPVVKGETVVPGKILPLSLTVDHRVVDGGEAARFVNRIRNYLSEPASLAVF